jgi:hypothetical protein
MIMLGKFLVGNLKGKQHVTYLGTDYSILLDSILDKYDVSRGLD